MRLPPKVIYTRNSCPSEQKAVRHGQVAATSKKTWNVKHAKRGSNKIKDLQKHFLKLEVSSSTELAVKMVQPVPQPIPSRRKKPRAHPWSHVKRSPSTPVKSDEEIRSEAVVKLQAFVRSGLTRIRVCRMVEKMIFDMTKDMFDGKIEPQDENCETPYTIRKSETNNEEDYVYDEIKIDSLSHQDSTASETEAQDETNDPPHLESDEEESNEDDLEKEESLEETQYQKARYAHDVEMLQDRVTTVLETMNDTLDDCNMQTHCYLALESILLSSTSETTSQAILKTILEEKGIQTLFRGWKLHPSSEAMHQSGLELLLLCSSQSLDLYEAILNEKGLDIVIDTMGRFPESTEMATKGAQFLQEFTRQSSEFQLAVFAKGGISLLVSLLKRHVHKVAYQVPAFACLRNLALHESNRRTIVKHDGIPVVLRSMKIHSTDPVIQAYGCDVLGRLLSISGESEENQMEGFQRMELVLTSSGMDAALSAMAQHPRHAGVQDRAIFLLLKMLQHPSGLKGLQHRRPAFDLIRSAALPDTAAAKERHRLVCQSLRFHWLSGLSV